MSKIIKWIKAHLDSYIKYYAKDIDLKHNNTKVVIDRSVNKTEIVTQLEFEF